MERIDRILAHPLFIERLQLLKALESDRIYCKHGLPHLLDTARIACLLQYELYEKNPEIDRILHDIIYAAALLHDIGRTAQYEKGLPHETAALEPAKIILSDCNFSKEEQHYILEAIQFHQKEQKYDDKGSLRDLIYRADHLSRCCFACPAADTCYWPDRKKNPSIWW